MKNSNGMPVMQPQEFGNCWIVKEDAETVSVIKLVHF